MDGLAHRFASGEHVLLPDGRPNAGYTLSGDAVYERKRVRAAPWRIKEWDFYQISDRRLCLQVVIGHVSYAGNCNVALFDHETGVSLFEQGVITALPFNGMRMPESAHGASRLGFSRGDMRLTFDTAKDDTRFLRVRAGALTAEVSLAPSVKETILVNTPFARRFDFYCNEKINLLKADVRVSIGDTAYPFDPENTFALLDWGRGVWPYRHEWYWSSVSARLNGLPFGFNLGCGFGDESRRRGTENIVYYGDSIVKLGTVDFFLDAPMQPWRIAARDGRFFAALTPRYDRDTATKLLFVSNRCHQVFGAFSGFFVNDAGIRIPFSNAVGFAEHAVNRW